MTRILGFGGVVDHSRFLLESPPGSSPSSSASGSSAAACNSKQTINAGDNPCPAVQSPLPYMLAGLAAMVLLVVISLLILACSYLRGYFALEQEQARQQQAGGGGGGGATAAAGGGGGGEAKGSSLSSLQGGIGCGGDKILVILPGEAKPTHLAQPLRVVIASPIFTTGATRTITNTNTNTPTNTPPTTLDTAA